MVAVSPVAKRSQAVATHGVVDEAGIDILMRRFIEQNRGELTVSPEPSQAEEPANSDGPPRNFAMATDLLDRASQAFELLVDRCQRLEHDLNQETERGRAQAAEQNDTIEQWKRLASGLKAQAEAAEQAAAALKQRCDTAEARAAMAEQRAAALEQTSARATDQAALAEQLSTRLHDKVVSAFGIGSRAHPVLEAVATQTAE